MLLDHLVWFRHFSDNQHRVYQSATYYEIADVPTFTEIASYFGLCVWLVPFALFVSLSASDNVLPTTMGGSDGLASSETFGTGGVMGAGADIGGSSGGRSRSGQGMAKGLVASFGSAIVAVGVLAGLKKQEHQL